MRGPGFVSSATLRSWLVISLNPFPRLQSEGVKISQLLMSTFKSQGELNRLNKFPDGSVVKNLHARQKTQVRSLGEEGLLEKGMATHCSILAWEIPWTEEPGRLPSMRSQKT